MEVLFMSDINYIQVEWDGETMRRVDNNKAATFQKLVSVQLDGEEITTKLSMTTVYYDEHGETCDKATSRYSNLKPCVRVNGERVDLDSDRLLIAEESVIT